MGTSIAKEHAQPEIALRAESYGLAAWPVDGMDVFAVEAAATRAVEAIRGGAGPHLLELRTFRFRAHSMYDPDRYREKAEIEQWRHHDPIDALVATMRAAGQIDDAGLSAAQEEVAALVAASVDTADLAPFEPVETLTRFVTSVDGTEGGPR
jgi:pyruvate dehydrogenase E1 component alpha subunit